MHTLYHSSPMGHISDFRTMTHFGTRESALALMTGKKLDKPRGTGQEYQDDVARLKAMKAFLYEVHVDLDNLKVLAVDDYGNTSMRHFQSNAGLEQMSLTEAQRRRISDIAGTYEMAERHHLMPHDYRLYLYKALGTVLEADVFSYENVVEDVGNTSYVIIDPAHILGMSVSEMTHADFTLGYKHISPFRLPTLRPFDL